MSQRLCVKFLHGDLVPSSVLSRFVVEADEELCSHIMQIPLGDSLQKPLYVRLPIGL